MPADSPSVPVSTRSISTRPAACCAFSLPGSSGAGACEKAIFDTSFGFALANASIAPWVSCNWPATSMTLSDTGADGSAGAVAARARVAPRRGETRHAAEQCPAVNDCPDHGRFSPLVSTSPSVAPGT